MALLSVLHRASPENPSTTLGNPATWLVDAFGGGSSTSGVAVTPQSAMGSTAVFAAIRLIAQTIGSLPCMLYQRTDERSKDVARRNPLYRVLHDEANPDMPAQQFFELVTGHAVGWGNGYAEIEWSGRGEVKAFWPLAPDRVRIERRNGERIYWVQVPAGDGKGDVQVALRAENVLHVPGFGYDGVQGYSPIKVCRDAIGLAIATEKFGSSLFANGSRPSGILSHPKNLSAPAREELRRTWDQFQTGLSNAQRVAVLEEDMKWTPTTIAPDDAQFLQTRQFQVAEIARLFGVPPHLIQDLTRSTFSNIEHQGIEFVTHTMRPWAVRWEKQLNLKCIPIAQQETLFAEFKLDALLRGDTGSRFAAYKTGIEGGWFSPNDVRALENMNPREGGDHYQDTPVGGAPNAAPAAQDAPDAEDPPVDTTVDAKPPEKKALDVAAWHATLPALEDALHRADRRANQVKDLTGHGEYVARAILPALRGYAAAIAGGPVPAADGPLETFARAWGEAEDRKQAPALRAAECLARCAALLAADRPQATSDDRWLGVLDLMQRQSDAVAQLAARPLPTIPVPEVDVRVSPLTMGEELEYTHVRGEDHRITATRVRRVKPNREGE